MNSSVGKNNVPSGGGSNLIRVRDYNERLVLSVIREKPQARAEIARHTGLSPQTITLITRALTADGLIRSGDPIRGKVGQPSVPLELNAEGAYFMGLKVGRRSAELVLINFVGKIVLQKEENYPYPTPDSILDFLSREIPEITLKLGADSQHVLHGLGIAIPYKLWNWSETLGAPMGLMESWKTFDFSTALAQITQLPVFVENDATAACGAELTFGQGCQHADFAYFFIGYFIGGGIVSNGTIYSGSSGNAGAFGSLPVIDPTTSTGIVQLIDTASIHLLESKIKVATDEKIDYLVHNSAVWNQESDLLIQWIEQVSTSLAMAIVSVTSVADVGVIVIDGGFPNVIRDKIVHETQKALENVNTMGIEIPDIVAGKIGAEARALGAARLPLFSRFLLDQTVLTKHNN